MTGVQAIGIGLDLAGRLARLILQRNPPFVLIGVLGAGLLALAVAGLRAPLPPAMESIAGPPLLADLGREEGWLALPMPEPAAGPPATGSGAASGDAIAAAPDPSLDDVAAELRGRRERLEARDRALDLRAAVVEAAEQRLGEQVTTLTALRDEVKRLLGEVDADQQARLTQLIKTYEAMPPKRAAAIFNGLDPDALERLARGMREAKIAPILAAMDPDRARALTLTLGAKHEPQIVTTESEDAGGPQRPPTAAGRARAKAP